jgi:hypothetical protein
MGTLTDPVAEFAYDALHLLFDIHTFKQFSDIEARGYRRTQLVK